MVSVTDLAATRWAAGASDAEVLAALGIGDVQHRCVKCGATDHGQPFAPGVGGLSLSRAGDVVVGATSDGPVGIDIERAGQPIDRGVVAHPSETADPLLLWVRKEALLKATGLGLAIAPESFWISEDGRISAIAGYDGPRLFVRDLQIDGYVAALATSCSPVGSQVSLD